jgi:anti-sigma-K factor RskA
MNEDIKKFLETSLLEEYTLGVISDSDRLTVENYLKSSKEVKEAYEKLQNTLLKLSEKVATPPPSGTKELILKAINTQNSITNKWWFAAASLMGLIFIATSIFLNDKNKSLEGSFAILQKEYDILESNCSKKEEQLTDQLRQMNIITDPTTKSYNLKGNEKAPLLNIIAYNNNDIKSSYLKLVSLPALPKDKCFQLWADIEGKMVSLNIIPNSEDKIIAIPFKDNIESFNITIEPAGGSLEPNVSELVASVRT